MSRAPWGLAPLHQVLNALGTARFPESKNVEVLGPHEGQSVAGRAFLQQADPNLMTGADPYEDMRQEQYMQIVGALSNPQRIKRGLQPITDAEWASAPDPGQ